MSETIQINDWCQCVIEWKTTKAKNVTEVVLSWTLYPRAFPPQKKFKTNYLIIILHIYVKFTDYITQDCEIDEGLARF